MRVGGFTTVLRWVCIAVLAAALLLTLPRQKPRDVGFDRLQDRVRTGQVTEVQVSAGSGSSGSSGSNQFRWHEGPLRWYQAFGPPDAQRQLERTAAAPGAHGLSFTTVDMGPDRFWFQTLSNSDEPSWLVFTASSLWVALFFVMLATREHAYANRWAWFWLFTVGGVGPILMLFKEPRPLRVPLWGAQWGSRSVPLRLRRAGRSAGRAGAPRVGLEPITGGVGLSYAIFWAIGLALGASALRGALS